MTELMDSVLNENEIVDVENVSVEISEQEYLSSEDSVQKEEISLPTTRIETVELIEQSIEKSVSEIKGEIEQLKQHYYKLRIQETEAARVAYEAEQADHMYLRVREVNAT